MTALRGTKVAILVADMFEQVELTEPRKALEEAGAAIDIISLEDGEVQGFDHYDKADTVAVDRTVEEASADDYDALLLPGGVGNPNSLRQDENAVELVRSFFEQGKPVAAICHAVDAHRGRRRVATARSPRIRASRPTSATPARAGWTGAAAGTSTAPRTARAPSGGSTGRSSRTCHGYPSLSAVAVAQLVEPRVVVPVVVGSSPIGHPSRAAEAARSVWHTRRTAP